MARNSFDLLTADAERTARARASMPPAVETRDAGDIVSTLDRPEAWLANLLGNRSITGTAVTSSTALSDTTFHACVSILSDMIATLPIKLYAPFGEMPLLNADEDVPASAAKEMKDHPAYYTLAKEPNENDTPFEFRRDTQASVGIGGMGYGRVRRSRGDVEEIRWLRPVDVTPKELNDGSKVYEWRNPRNGETQVLTRRDLIVVRAMATDGVRGISPVQEMRETIGLSLALRDQTSNLIKNGMTFPGVVVAPTNATPSQMKEFRDNMIKLSTGNNAGKIPVIWASWEYKQINGMNLKDAEFLASRSFQVAEIARFFRMPLFLLNSTEKATTWGSGLQQLNEGFLSYTLNPWLKNWEDALGKTLLTKEERRNGMFFRFTREALLQVAIEARASFFQIMRNIGAMNNDEIRAKMEMNPIPNGRGSDWQQPFNGAGGAAPSRTDENTTPPATKEDENET